MSLFKNVVLIVLVKMVAFMRYIQPDIAIITSVAPEHMEFSKI
ncbi:hypothetical protein [Candidatus Minimicrobia naudis]